MIPLTLKQITDAVNGQLIVKHDIAGSASGKQIINQIVTDSRAINASSDNASLDNTSSGIVFLALKGPNFDGHRFVEQVCDNGCSAAIVDHRIKQIDKKAHQIVVADTRIALGQIAAYVKQQVSPKTVGITGSSGKTTVKEMVAAILSRLGNVLATKGNFNNDIGVPLTLLRLEKQHDFAVIEMGANHLGEIAYTANLVKPDVAIINNIAAAHLEGFGDLCGVARAKGEIFSGLPEKGIAIYNQDSKFIDKWQWRLEDKLKQNNVRTFSCAAITEQESDSAVVRSAQNQANCYASDIRLDANGCASFTLHTVITDGMSESTFIELTIPGQHNVCNAVAAASIALAFSASLDDIRLGLAQMSPVQGRLNLHQINKHIKLIDDTYNANVESVKAATQLLASYSGKRILILGDMGELGEEARNYHQEIGEYARQLHLDMLLTLGVLSQSTTDAFSTQGANALNTANINEVISEVTSKVSKKSSGESHHFSVRASLLEYIFSVLNENWHDLENTPISILVKGSRSAHMEYVVQEIIDWCNSKNAINKKNNNNSQLEEVSS